MMHFFKRYWWLLVSFLCLSCSDLFQPKVEMDLGASKNLSDLIYAKDKEPYMNLDPPTQILVSEGEYNDRIELSWTPVKNADSYTVEWARVLKTNYDSVPKYDIENLFSSEIDNVNRGEKTDIFATAWTHKLIYSTVNASKNELYDYYYFYRVCPLSKLNPNYVTTEESSTPYFVPEKDALGVNLPIYNTRDTDGAPLLFSGNTQVATTTQGRNRGYLFATPRNLNATTGEKSSIYPAHDPTYQVVVSWDPVPDATYYHVYKADNETGNGATLQIDSISKTSDCHLNYFIDNLEGKAGQTFYYMVTAVRANGAESCRTDTAPGRIKQEGAPDASKVLVVKNGLGGTTDGFDISWEVPSDAPSNGDLYFQLYRSKSSDGFGSKEKVGGEQPYSKGNKVGDEPNSYYLCGNPYRDSRLTDNVIYCYYVEAIVKQKTDEGEVRLLSPFSNTAPEIIQDGNKISNPDRAIGFKLCPTLSEINVSLKENQQVRITWGDATGVEYLPDDKKFGYKIYTCDERGDSRSCVKTYTASNLEKDKESGDYYFYEGPVADYFCITTIGKDENGNDVESAATSPSAPAPNAPSEVKASKTEAIEGFTDSDSKANNNGVFPVRVTWKKPVDGTAPAYYKVRRSKKRLSGFSDAVQTLIKVEGGSVSFLNPDPKKVGDSRISYDSESETFIFIDVNETSKPEEYYYYQVISKNSLQQGANSNKFDKDSESDLASEIAARGYGALTHEQWFREFNKTTISSHKKMDHLNKKSSLDKLGHDNTAGAITGNVDYNAKMDGLGARIIIYFDNYCDALVKSKKDEGYPSKSGFFDYRYFTCYGNTNTSASMDASGTMDGTVYVTSNGYQNIGNNENGGAMYPGTCGFDKLKVKGGDAGGGVYPITTYDLKGNVVLPSVDVRWNAAM